MRIKKVKCPYCGKEVLWTEESKYKPFCSERCYLADLGRWLEWGEEDEKEYR
ncbi:MAG: DNA gyrase inhibitor YacG [bacterium]|nr:DNA gyrase inhibitor YacG [bacterium]